MPVAMLATLVALDQALHRAEDVTTHVGDP